MKFQLENADNSGATPITSISDSVPMLAYAIEMTLFHELRHKPAGDPYDNSFENEDRLISLNIRSLQDFDITHPANTSLNEYFLTQLSSMSTIDRFVTIGEIGRGDLSGYNYIDSWTSLQYFFLMKPPSVPGTKSFVVEIGLSDGRNLSDTVNVTLLP